jgi:phage protein U
MTMFAQLGSVVFEVVGALTEFGARREYGYAEHARIENKPTVQYVGEGLEEADLGFALDEWLCEPADALQALHQMAEAHQAVPLLWGSAVRPRSYVLRNIEHTVAQAGPDGRPQRITGRIKLQEWAPPPSATETRTAGTGPAVGPEARAGAQTPPPNRPAGTDARSTPVNATTRQSR